MLQHFSLIGLKVKLVVKLTIFAEENGKMYRTIISASHKVEEVESLKRVREENGLRTSTSDEE